MNKNITITIIIFSVFLNIMLGIALYTVCNNLAAVESDDFITTTDAKSDTLLEENSLSTAQVSINCNQQKDEMLAEETSGVDDNDLESDNVEYDFHSNWQYDERLSIFELNHEKTEIVFAGDSLTQKYLLEEFYPSLQILNRGIGSDVSAGLLNRFDEVLSHSPDKVFIWIGINDIARDIDISDTTKNVRECVEKALSEDTEVYVVSVLPTNEGVNTEIRNLNKEYEQLCMEENVKFINLFDYFLDEDDVIVDYYGPDGVHLNGKGYTVVTDILREYVYD